MHRIGRTARGGREGVAISLVSDREMSRLHQLETERGTGAMTLWRTDSADESASAVAESIPEPAVYTLEINGGRKQKLRPGDILGTLTASKELSADAVGKIDILPMVSYVAIAKEHSGTAQKLINGRKIKGRQYRACLLYTSPSPRDA